MDTTAEHYWKRFEAETGERLVLASMGQRLEPGQRAGKWGLVFLTDKALRYRHMPSRNSFLSIFSLRQDQGEAEREEDVVYAYGTILALAIPPRTWWDRLFGSPFQSFTITVGKPDGTREECLFCTDPGHRLPETLKDRIGTPPGA